MHVLPQAKAKTTAHQLAETTAELQQLKLHQQQLELRLEQAEAWSEARSKVAVALPLTIDTLWSESRKKHLQQQR